MSLVITLHGQEGIVMASDSRLTINHTDSSGPQSVVQVGVSQSDTNYKTFLGHAKIGISTFGAAFIKGVPISGYIESFLNERITDETDIEEVPRLLIDYFQQTPEIPAAGFHVAGYRKVNGQLQQRIWRCFPTDKGVQDVAPAIQQQGALWNGEQDVLTRIINQSIYFHADDGSHQLLPHHAVPFEMFTLQDMIDFAVYGIRTTADTMRFQLRPKTVGGPIDALVIKATEAEWISRKILQVVQ
jgi:hypothetical protein